MANENPNGGGDLNRQPGFMPQPVENVPPQPVSPARAPIPGGAGVEIVPNLPPMTPVPQPSTPGRRW